MRCFVGCTQDAVIKALKDRGLWKESNKPAFRKSSKPAAARGCTLEQYAEAKHLDMDFLKFCELSELKYHGTPAVRIPYLDKDGQTPAVRIRRDLHKKDGMGLRFVWRKGSKLCLYGLWRLDRDAPYIFLVEGESDCHTMWQHGISAAGIPGM